MSDSDAPTRDGQHVLQAYVDDNGDVVISDAAETIRLTSKQAKELLNWLEKNVMVKA